MAELCCAAESVRAAISGHMAREEAAVLPLLQAGLTAPPPRHECWPFARARAPHPAARPWKAACSRPARPPWAPCVRL